MIKRTFRKVLLVLIFSVCVLNISAHPPKHEMRGVWIASVSNIDWPSRQNLTCDEQQKELTVILDGLAANNINTVIVQVRPSADALYNSYYEPWSHWLTGQQGKRPEPFYDPLEFITDEAHKRFMDVHVWLNPYRVTANSKTDLCAEHLFFKNQDLFIQYANKYYFD
ncbi:family 10 glycosylhydrolase, partial [Paludibacteraceae bacterium OttesenSCG-928-F17]|nr:family 10 glycosylhydrolase [Paludibacteraceae bacterium OttesenSCG-928-F17]